MKEVNTAFTGVALQLSPRTDFAPKKQEQRLTLSAFYQNAIGLWPTLTKILLLSALLQIFALTAPYYSQLVIDEAIIKEDLDLLTVLALGFGLLMIMGVVTVVLREWVVSYLKSQLTLQMGRNLMHHLLHLPMTYFERRHMGDIVSRFGSLQSIREIFTNALVEGLVDGVMAVLVLVMMYLYNPTLSALAVSVVVVYAALRLGLYSKLRSNHERFLHAAAKSDSVFMESVRAAQSVKLYNHMTGRLHRWQDRQVDAINQQFKLDLWRTFYLGSNRFLFGLESIVIVYFAAQAIIDNTLSLGMWFAFFAYKTLFSARMAALIDTWIDLKMVELHLDRLSDIALTPKEVLNKGRKPALLGRIEVKGLGYRHPAADEWVFRDLSFTVEPGEHVAITGPSGVGKSTLLKILLGLLPYEEGEVLIDGTPLKQLNITHYRHHVASVMQDDQLLSGSIIDNVTFFDERPDLEKCERVCQQAHIHDDILAMAMGYQSLVGDMGSSLSGGQKQRLLLARALYRQPRLLMMDEATSHLDGDLEKAVNQQLKQLKMTQITIAHRQETIAAADRVITLHKKTGR